MKIIFALFVLSSLAVGSDLPQNRGNFVPPELFMDVEELNRNVFIENKEQNAQLKRIKYHLLNGEMGIAKSMLSKIAQTRGSLRPVVLRYLGLMAFLEGKFKRSHDYLDSEELRSFPHFSKVCVLKTLNEIVLDKKGTLSDTWERCKADNFLHVKESNIPWMDALVYLKLRPFAEVGKSPLLKMRIPSLEPDELKVLLKLGLYLNQEKIIIPQLTQMDLEQVSDPEVRELISQIYFRNGEFVNANKFVDGIKSPNAENLKGNLYLLREKYELAYAQFKASLELKQNSQNALERLMALAWILGDWTNGTVFAEKVIASPQTQINKLTLLSAFQAQKGDYEAAKRTIASINQTSRKGSERDVTQIASFVALMQNDEISLKKNASLSCDQYDLLNCWTLYQIHQWGGFPLTTRRNEDIMGELKWEKLTQEIVNQPMKETVYVNQIDIEELDDKLIQLIPKENQ